jgi:hypothetical protein
LLTVVALTQSSSAASLKLRRRAATSKVRNAVKGRFLGFTDKGESNGCYFLYLYTLDNLLVETDHR